MPAQAGTAAASLASEPLIPPPACNRDAAISEVLAAHRSTKPKSGKIAKLTAVHIMDSPGKLHIAIFSVRPFKQ